MTNDEYVALLKQGVTAWSEWRDKNPYFPSPNLREADFSMADLRGANLIKADLSGANLNQARLNGADLSGAKFWQTVFGDKHHRPSNPRTIQVITALISSRRRPAGQLD
jgi:uncharacterized protein YjbI with pentapeptide repeats